MIAEQTRKAVFLDRDGTISSDEFGYINDPEGYHLYPNTGEALRQIKSMGYMLFVVTNQSGIARGRVTPTQLNAVHEKLRRLMLAEDVSFDSIYYSPYYKEGVVSPYNIDHEDRKPGLGMFKTALAEHGFDIAKSWMIGDRYSDVAFGKKAGLKTVLLLTGNGRQELATGFVNWEYTPDFVAEDILTAAALIRQMS